MEGQSLSLAPCMSRRAFFSLTAVVGSLHVLGSVLGGRLIAYADDAGNESFLIVVMCPYEISVLASDVTEVTPTGAYKALEGVTMTVTSNEEGREGLSVTGVTNEYGVAILDVKALSKQADDPYATHFSLYASCEASLPGYREFAMDEIFIIAGPRDDQLPNFSIATQPFDAAKDGAYVRIASFNGADVQYLSQEFAKFPTNTIDHTLHIQVVTSPGKTAHASLLINDKVVGGPVTAVADSNGRADCMVVGPWNARGQIGDKFSATFGVEGFDDMAMNLNMALIDTQINYDPESGDGKEMAVGTAPGDSEENGTSNASVLKNIVDVPNLPVGSLFRVILDLPFLPVMYYKDAYGSMGISINFVSIDTNTKKNALMQGPKAWIDDWTKEMNEGVEGAKERYAKANPPKDSGMKGKAQKFGGKKLSFDAFLILAARRQWIEEEQALKYIGTVKSLNALIFSAEWGYQLPTGPFPTFVSLDIYLELDFSVQARAKFADPFAGGWEWDAFKGVAGDDPGFLIDFLAMIGFTAACGVKGLASLGIRAYGKLDTKVELLEEIPEEESNHWHIKMDICGGGQLVFQFLFFSTKWTFYESPTCVLFSNWESDHPVFNSQKQLNELPAANSHLWMDPALTLPVADGEWHMTTDHMLMKPSTRGLRAEANELSREHITATLNAQGVAHGYNLSTVNSGMQRLNSRLSETLGGIKNPYAGAESNGSGAFDARKGAVPLVDDIITEDAFSDPRFKRVQIGDVVYFCRLGLVEMDASQLKASGIAKVVDCGGNLFLVLNDETANGPAAFPHPSFVVGPSQGIPVEGYLDYGGEYKSVAHLAGGEATPPCVARLLVERFIDEGESEEERINKLNKRMQDLVALVDGSRNGESFLAGLEGSAFDTLVNTRILVTPYYLTNDDEVGYFGDTDIVDFVLPSSSTETLRCNINDVDFDVIRDGDCLRFGIVSATRPPMLRPTPDDAKKLQFTNTVLYNPAAAAGTRVSQAFSNLNTLLVDEDYEWKALPFAVTHEGKECVCMVSTGVRGTILGDDPGFIAHYYAVDGGELGRNTHAVIPPAGMEINDYGMLDVLRGSELKDSDGNDVFALVWAYNEFDQETPRTALWTVSTGTGKTLGSWDLENTMNMCRIGDGSRGIAYSRPSPRLELGEESDEHAKIFRAFFESPKKLTEEELIGNVDSTQFALSDDGNYLYTMRVMEGSYEEPEQANATSTLDPNWGGDVFVNESPFVPEGQDARSCAIAAQNSNGETKVAFYQVLCSMWDPDFTEYHPFFAFGKLNSAPDSHESFKVMRGASVMYNTITDFENQKSAITFSHIPYITGIQLQGASCADAFIPAGATVHPIIAVSNTGNVPVRQLTLKLTSEDGLVNKTYVLDDLTKYVYGIFDNASQVNGRAMLPDDKVRTAALRAAEGDAVSNDLVEEIDREKYLWPGDMRRYMVELKTPESWTGQYVVTAVISDPVPADLYGDKTIRAAAEAMQAGKIANGDMYAAELKPVNGMVYLVDPRPQTTSIETADSETSIGIDTRIRRNDYVPVGGSGGSSDKPVSTGDSMGKTVGVLGAAAVAAGAVAVGAKTIADKRKEDACEGEN